MGRLIKIVEKLFLISLLLNITSIFNVKLWESESEPTIDYQLLDIEYINSIAYDYENDYEVILGNKKETNESYFFIIKDGEKKREILNKFKVEKIQSPLIKHNDTYFFCSSYLKLLYIKDGILYQYNNTCGQDFDNEVEMKCYKMKDYIAIMYLNSHCFFALNLNNFKYITFTTFDGNYNFKAINNVYQLDNSIQKFIILREHKQDYYLTEIKFDNDFVQEGDDINFGNTTFNFHKKIEITPLEKQEVIIFTYDIDKENECLFYRVRKVKDYIIQINGLSNFLKFLNQSKIISAGFIENTQLLYYSIKNINNKENKDDYIGVADLINLMVIYNLKINDPSVNLNLFTNHGYLTQNKLYLNYIEKNKIIRYCPFVKEGNYCIYYVGESNFFRIKKNENHLYNNLNVSDCDGKNVNNFYCLDYCPIGYSTNEENNLCTNCFKNIDEKDKYYYSFKNKACSTECKNITKGNFNICYDCDESKPILFENQCIASCDDVFGIKNVNSECETCKELKKYYYKNKTKEEGECIERCHGKINKFNNICTLCEDENLLFFPLINDCVSSCPTYFIKKNNNCELCLNASDHPENIYYEEFEKEKKMCKFLQ